MITLVLTIGLIAFIFLATLEMLYIRHLKREFAKKWAKRPIGKILSLEMNKDGLGMTGEIWDDAVADKIRNSEITNLSMGPFRIKE